MVDLLHARGASLNDCNSENKTALHSAAAYETTALVRHLVQKGAEINARSSYGSTPIFLATQNGRLATAKLLLEHGADPKLGRLGHGNARERGPKHIAKRGRNLEVVQLLECWERGEDFGPVKDDGESPVRTDFSLMYSMTETVFFFPAVIDKGVNDYECSWEYWFDKYVVEIYEKELAAKAQQERLTPRTALALESSVHTRN
jgi:hypothetical protein